MFVDAIERIDTFTRPVHSIIRLYGHGEIVPGSATLFFVNETGCAVTCKHVAELLINADQINQNYRTFQSERGTLLRNAKHTSAQLQSLEERFKINPQSLIQIKNLFPDSIDQFTAWKWFLHPVYDLAVVQFSGFTKRFYSQYATFARDSSSVKPGRMYCRLGYPFPDFNNFRYNEQVDDIEWTTTGRIKSPRFPIEGMVTRLMADPNGTISGIEMSTPGLRGQSGGPLFDERGLIYGMQSATRHLHLGFDIEGMDVLVNNRKAKVSNYPFLNVGLCVHVDVIKRYLTECGIKYYEA
ncbi:MAG: serine protease [Cytophagales bacterium]|nr:MAG: serine protease [Cytophagales bacterium]